ncbi:uncharacterized protein LOC101762551 [Setaria italica]|uniref:uncharacterized protein LOC101762551 n=1 Tax=Setaria italica TaxID=4555 RepID=UPI000BE4D8D9|nr:uncharacterized protein LOC101762551 [Setaria italica]
MGAAARVAFDGMPRPHAAVRNTLTGVYARVGRLLEAFCGMRLDGRSLAQKIVQVGMGLLECMEEQYGLVPDIEFHVLLAKYHGVSAKRTSPRHHQSLMRCLHLDPLENIDCQFHPPTPSPPRADGAAASIRHRRAASQFVPSPSFLRLGSFTEPPYPSSTRPHPAPTPTGCCTASSSHLPSRRRFRSPRRGTLVSKRSIRRLHASTPRKEDQEPAATTKSIMMPQVWTKQCQHLNPDSDSATRAAAAPLFAHCWSRSMALATSCSPLCPSLCSLSSSSTLQVLVEHDHKPTYLISKA